MIRDIVIIDLMMRMIMIYRNLNRYYKNYPFSSIVYDDDFEVIMIATLKKCFSRISHHFDVGIAVLRSRWLCCVDRALYWQRAAANEASGRSPGNGNGTPVNQADMNNTSAICAYLMSIDKKLSRLFFNVLHSLKCQGRTGADHEKGINSY